MPEIQPNAHRPEGYPAAMASTPSPADPDLSRCWWSEGARPDPRMQRYHDEDWGTPVHGDAELFARLSLEAFQSGLSWSTILNKWDAFHAAFRGFEPRVVAAFGPADRDRLMADAGIVRNGAKIDATIANANVALGLIAEFGSLDGYFRTIVPAAVSLGSDAGPGDLPVTTPVAEALSKDLRRRGMRFVGPTVVYSFMQSVGLVDDHLPGCFRYRGAAAG
jgi:DNA-3-methyladenine glycosylase I